jgi:predicted dehydrogenase/threonine dehydrogenase-like Zn-dependent dehydrogenase
MKQIIQSYRTGELRLTDVPVPLPGPGYVLVQTAFSAVSLGTEGKKVTTARQSLVGKARSRPDLVRQVMRSAQREGIGSTYRKVMSRLDEPVSLGYSAAGIVVATGPGVETFQIGQRVACAGEGAAHAELLVVPVNLCAKVPDSVQLDHAAMATIGAIALQGVRQSAVTLGETVAVIGLGLVGLLTVQLLKANGCRVIGIDVDPAKVALAHALGADHALERGSADLKASVAAFSRGAGADAVILTAATTSNDPIELAVAIARDRGRLVVVGGIPMNIPRDAAYHKELEIKLSRSYGPGRYDPTYEEKGHDYPLSYVRWTEQRNMEAFLDLLASRHVDLAPLITHRFPFEQAEEAYALLTGERPREAPPAGVIFEYDTAKNHLASTSQLVPRAGAARAPGKLLGDVLGVGFIGAGSFARKFLIPPLVKQPGIQLLGVATATGMSGQGAAQKFGFHSSTGDYAAILNDPDIHTVFIATRHNLHSQVAAEALRAGKTVFVEKPLALTRDQLRQVVAAYESQAQQGAAQLMVGFNRRFAPHVQELRRWFQDRIEPMAVQYRINAGFIEPSHWAQDPEEGGGRILGEVCHFIDLICFLVGAPLMMIYAQALDNGGRYRNDNVSITLRFADSSIGTILYLANGDAALPKERCEVFCQGASAVLDDFCRLELYRNGHRQARKAAQDKGHQAEVQAFIEAVRAGSELPISFAECVSSTLATLRVLESLQQGAPLALGEL